ncbi:MAG: PLP-dependent aminotransferase family protein [Candidatus Eremiobacteraeota bacterium]|jgi:DNA-binding transcriptional MocR family regulator|nr:PLP-dependent aminotransferase family protein [Candidatus Eremiobacteraeota bacterium]
MRTGWSELAIALDRASIVPVYRQIYERLREQILVGALPEETRLPPERALAGRLGVNRSTVVHAYRDLAADGLIEQRVGSGSRVASTLRGGQPDRSAAVPWWVTLPPWRVGQFPAVLGELAASGHGDVIGFVQGVPPADPSPLEDLSRSFARVGGDVNFVLTYGDSEGYAPLREAIAARMRARGCAVDPRDVLVLTGSTQGITLVAQSLAEPGDEIVVEAPTYPGALQIFQIAGLRAITVPVDEGGMRVDHIEAILRTRRPRFIYTMPAIHNPTGVTMNADRRDRLVVLAKRFGVPVVEDDPYGELVNPGASPLLARDAEYVIYLSSFSKTIAPSLRLGWLVAPRTIYERLLLRKQSFDMASSMYIQAGVRDYLESGYDPHVAALRMELKERRAIAFAAIERYWPSQLRAAKGGDGYYLWATAPRDLRARALLTASERHGASFMFGEAFFAQSGGDHNFRLALTPVPRSSIEEGIRRIGEAAR